MRLPSFLCATLPTLCQAATLWVEPTGLCPFVDVQAAVDAAQPGDLVLVFPGTYGPVDLEDKNLVLRSTGGAAVTVIDAGGGGSALRVRGSVGPETLIAGFTFTGGTGTVDATSGLLVGGGALVERGARPRLAANRITGNTAETGAGLAVVNAAPQCFDSVVDDNLASFGSGGVFIGGGVPAASETVLACVDLLANEGTLAGGGLVDSGSVFLFRNEVVGNLGQVGGLVLAPGPSVELRNNTVVANQGGVAGAGGLEWASASGLAHANIVAFNTGGPGVLRSAASGPFRFQDVFGHAADYGGLPDPTGTEGNLSQDPMFLFLTPQDAYDDDLGLLSASPLRGAGDPDPLWNDADGGPNTIGSSGGPLDPCDEDGDGVRPTDGVFDCRPGEAAFHPYAYELDQGLDLDCDGYGSTTLAELVLDDGGAVGSTPWVFGTPVVPPARGVQGAQAWAFGGASPAIDADGAELNISIPPPGPPGTTVRLSLTHAFDFAAGLDAAVLEVDAGAGYLVRVPVGGYGATRPPGLDPGVLPDAAGAAWAGSSAGYRVDHVDFTVVGIGSISVRLRVATGAGSPGSSWIVGRWSLSVPDGDGDGRATAAADCDPADPTVFSGAPELPYDGVDQDCDGADLDDVDGDLVPGPPLGGPDCDDTNPTIHPGAFELAYDGIDQDCDGADLDDVDGDGFPYDSDCEDADATRHPAAAEIPYDGLDQDCDGADLEDVDGDGHLGDRPPPFGDCDDGDPTVHPGADEHCGDGVDENCDGAIDFVPDADGDGHGPCDGDCADGAPTVFPGAEEACDGLDTDCEGGPGPGEEDVDADGVLPCGGDCDDDDARVGLRPDTCDGLDNDCDELIDEGHDVDGDGYSSCVDDCDDQRAFVYPGADPACSGGLDGDCDGNPDVLQGRCEEEGAACATTASPGLHPLGSLLLLLQRPRRTQRAPAKATPAGTGPAVSPARGTQAR